MPEQIKAAFKKMTENLISELNESTHQRSVLVEGKANSIINMLADLKIAIGDANRLMEDTRTLIYKQCEFIGTFPLDGIPNNVLQIYSEITDQAITKVIAEEIIVAVVDKLYNFSLQSLVSRN